MRLMLVLRYMFSPSNRHRARTVRIMAGLALSTMIVMVILSLMDFLQAGQLDRVRDIRSFPLTVSVSDKDEAYRLAKELSSSGRTFIYKEDKGLLAAGSDSAGVNIRYVGEDYDGGLFMAPSCPEEGICLPFRHYGMLPGGSEITLFILEEGQSVRMRPVEKTYPLECFFQSSLSDFDSSCVFLPLSEAPSSLEWIVAIKDLSVDEERLASALESEGYDVTMWYESESVLYSSLQLEKTVMSLLLSCLFLIFITQSVQSAMLLAAAKQKECVMLHLTGMRKKDVLAVFSITGALISLIALAAGLLLSRILLSLLPHMMSVFRTASFHLDLSYFAFLAVVMAGISAISYYRAFSSKLDEKHVMEVLMKP